MMTFDELDQAADAAQAGLNAALKNMQDARKLAEEEFAELPAEEREAMSSADIVAWMESQPYVVTAAEGIAAANAACSAAGEALYDYVHSPAYADELAG